MKAQFSISWRAARNAARSQAYAETEQKFKPFTEKNFAEADVFREQRFVEVFHELFYGKNAKRQNRA